MSTDNNVSLIHVDSFMAGFISAYIDIRKGKLDAPFTTYLPAISETTQSSGFRDYVNQEVIYMLAAATVHLKEHNPKLDDEEAKKVIVDAMKNINDYVEQCSEAVSHMSSNEEIKND